jgi:hypothetical protein
VTHLLNDVGDVAIWVSSIGIVIWVIQYSALAAWWRNTIGITMVGLALMDLAIYTPTLMALIWPARYADFAGTRWYLYLTVGIVTVSAVFIITRIATWEYIRRQRNPATLSPAARITELEAENEELRKRLGEGTV